MTVPNQWATIHPATNANYGSDMVPLWVSLQPYPQFGNGNYGDGNGVVVHAYPGGDSEYARCRPSYKSASPIISPRGLIHRGAS